MTVAEAIRAEWLPLSIMFTFVVALLIGIIYISIQETK